MGGGGGNGGFVERVRLGHGFRPREPQLNGSSARLELHEETGKGKGEREKGKGKGKGKGMEQFQCEV